MSDLFPDRIETDRFVLEPLTTENVDVLGYYRYCSYHDPYIEITTVRENVAFGEVVAREA